MLKLELMLSYGTSAAAKKTLKFLFFKNLNLTHLHLNSYYYSIIISLLGLCGNAENIETVIVSPMMLNYNVQIAKLHTESSQL